MGKTNRPPLPYLKHIDRHGVKRARTRIPLGNGKCREVSLGVYGSAESRAKHRDLCEEFEKAQTAGAVVDHGLTVRSLVGQFLSYAEKHYRDGEGNPTSEVKAYRLHVRPLLRLHGATLARDFGPLALKAVRQEMVASGWVRKSVNQAIGRIKRIFRWGASEQMLPAEVFAALQTVAGLSAGRTEAPDNAPVAPADWKSVRLAYRRLSPTLRAMVHLQLLTGMRPGEVCRLTAAEIDRNGPSIDGRQVWVYRPKQHKTAWRGKAKAVVLGPRAQRLLRHFLAQGKSLLFTPPRKNTRYTAQSYARRIQEACARAECDSWHPNQLRHSAATRIQTAFGLDGARAALGHSDPKTTLIYAERDLRQAAAIAAKIG